MSRIRRGRRGGRSGSSSTRLPERDIDGLVVIDKPRGLTSAAVVSRVKRVSRARRAGHTGTLDPLATGVLPICLGSATRLAAYLLADEKAYEGELMLGVETDTLDSDGQVTRRREPEASAVNERSLLAAMAQFVGDSDQVPPMYSALKRGGRPLYDLARAGETVERAPRPVHIDRFDLCEFVPPRARFSVECSKGTYVRSLVADLGTQLGCGAHLTSLRRTRSGCFHLRDAVQLSDLNEENIESALVEPARAVAHLAGFTLSESLVPAVSCGQRVPWAAVAESVPPPQGICRLLTPEGSLLALARVEDGRLRFERVFAVRA